MPWKMTIEDNKPEAEMAMEDGKSEIGTTVEGVVASCPVRVRLRQGKDDGDTMGDGGTTTQQMAAMRTMAMKTMAVEGGQEHCHEYASASGGELDYAF